jgi:hypothetical protein
MSGENIRLSTTYQPNFCVHQGYFFTFDYQLDNLLQKTDDGNTAFSYPFDILLVNAVKDAQFDGVCFWSEENPGGDVVYIKKWKIENYVCKLQQTFTLSSGVYAGNKFDSETFSIAHYHTSLVSAVSSGSSTIYLNDYWDDSSLMGFTTTSGAKLTLHLGPNTNAEEEDVTISSVVSSGVVLASGTRYSYDQNCQVNFFTHLWVFNNYNGVDNSTGALYKFDAYTGAYITKYASGAYKDVYASTFYNVDSFADYGNVDTLAYIKGTNTLFINVGAAGVTLPYYGSMVMKNVTTDTVPLVIVVYSLTMDDQNVYRLQLKQDNAANTWSTYNYQLSTLDAFVTSISLAAYPATIAANAIATTDIVAIVKDQFLQPIASRLVAFSDDDSVGFIITTPVNTDGDGTAQTSYRSGTSAREVKITAVVEQT